MTYSSGTGGGKGFYYELSRPPNKGRMAEYRKNGALYCKEQEEQKCSLVKINASLTGKEEDTDSAIFGTMRNPDR